MGRYLKLIDKLIRAQQELAENDKRVRDYWSSGEGNIGLLRVVGTDGESILLKVKDGKIVHASRDEKPIHVFKCSEDSVPSYSPVIIKFPDSRGFNLGYVDILPIEKLWMSIKSPIYYTSKGEEVKNVEGIKAYFSSSSRQWTEIKKIIRHLYTGKLIRIETIGGVIDTSPNHSIFKCYSTKCISGSIKPVNAKDIKVGDRILVTDIKPPKNRGLFIGNNDLAWFYGFFTAEGCASQSFYTKYGNRRYDQNQVIVSNTNLKLLEKARNVFKNNFHRRVSLDNKGTPEQQIKSYGRKLYNFFNSYFYANGMKKVPKEILNAPKNIQSAYLKGYYDGDGHEESEGVTRFGSNSWTLVMGILWLENAINNRSWNLHTRNDKPNVIEVRMNKSSTNRFEKNVVTKVRKIPYSGYLYDLETSCGRFVTGVGGIVAHNTFLDILSREMTLREAATKGYFSIEDSDTGEINLVELQKFAKAFEELNYLLRNIL